MSNPVEFVARKSNKRGHADHDWLKTYHTFSFASYMDYNHLEFGPLRVINEDNVQEGTGFGRHSHRDAEIFSYIVSGELEHKDSLGNLEIMKRGEVQMTSTGSGISHSEYNRNLRDPVHFLQIWCTPTKRGLTPNYYTREFTDESKTDALVKIVAPIGSEGIVDQRTGDGPTPIHSPVTVFASILTPQAALTHSTIPTTTKIYIHNIMKSGYRSPRTSAPADGSKLKLSDGNNHTLELEEGDGVYIYAKNGQATLQIESIGGKAAEFLLFELED